MLLVLMLRSRPSRWLLQQMLVRPWTRLVLTGPLVLIVGGQALGLWLGSRSSRWGHSRGF